MLGRFLFLCHSITRLSDSNIIPFFGAKIKIKSSFSAFGAVLS
jgi:hypothetical protein